MKFLLPQETTSSRFQVKMNTTQNRDGIKPIYNQSGIYSRAWGWQLQTLKIRQRPNIESRRRLLKKISRFGPKCKVQVSKNLREDPVQAQEQTKLGSNKPGLVYAKACSASCGLRLSILCGPWDPFTWSTHIFHAFCMAHGGLQVRERAKACMACRDWAGPHAGTCGELNSGLYRVHKLFDIVLTPSGLLF